MRSQMTSNATDTPGPAPFDTFEPPPISAASFSGKAAFWRTSIPARFILFVGHLRRCRCPHFKRAKIAFHARFGVKLFHHHLVGCGICPSEPVREENAAPALVTAFLRLVSNPSRGEGADASALCSRRYRVCSRALGEDVGQWNAHAVRNFLLRTCQPVWSSDHTEADYFPPGVSAVSQLPWRISATISPSRYPLSLTGGSPSLPRCLSAEEVNRLIAACDGSDPGRLRDRAIYSCWCD